MADNRHNIIFRRLFEAGIIGITISDTNGSITRANDAFLQMLGYEHKDLPLHRDELTPPQWKPMDQAIQREMLESGVGQHREKEYWHRNGHRVPVLVGEGFLEPGRSTTVCFVLNRTEQVTQGKQLKKLRASIAVAEEQERRRIAMGIHDEISQNLAVARLKLGYLERLDLSTEAGQSLAHIIELLERSLHACRGLTFELASSVLYELGLEAALEDLGHRLEHDHAIKCEIRNDGPRPGISSELDGFLFRITRELIHNVVKHARARSVQIHLKSSADRIRIAIVDDGVGFDVGAQSRILGGFGLLNARERLNLIGGRLEVDSAPGSGTRVEIVVPTHSQRHASRPAAEGTVT